MSGKIVTIGEIVVEIMALEVGNGFRAPTPLIGPFPSGAPAIFIDQVAKLGQACGMISCVGNDDFGMLNIERLKSSGADVSAIAIDDELVTGSAFVRYRTDGQRDFVFNIKHSACSKVGLDDAGRALLEGATHLHIMGSSLYSAAVIDAVRIAIDMIKAMGGTISFDPNIRKELLESVGMRGALAYVLEHTDLFLPSGPELFLFAEATTEAEAVAKLLAKGIKAIVVKKGSEGASFYADGIEANAAAFSVTEVDPTGAGDTFGATFVTYWLQGMAPAEALTFANAAGALAVSAKGPMEGASTRAQLDAFIASQDIRS